MLKATVLSVQPIIGLYYENLIPEVLLDVRRLHNLYIDTVELSDQFVSFMEKGLSDSVWVSDASTYSAEVNKADLVLFDDLFERACSFHRDFSEIVSLQDANAFALMKPISDGINFSDLFLASTSKVISDRMTISDTQFAKSISFGKADRVIISDSFFLYGNSYCDSSYFAEDYAGTFRST